ncbi:hypothetical protein ACN28S_41955 [Cystobacter fuscus]
MERELNTLPGELAAHARLCALLGPDFTLDELEDVVRELDRTEGAQDFPLDPRHATRRLLELGLLVDDGRATSASATSCCAPWWRAPCPSRIRRASTGRPIATTGAS